MNIKAPFGICQTLSLIASPALSWLSDQSPFSIIHPSLAVHSLRRGVLSGIVKLWSASYPAAEERVRCCGEFDQIPVCGLLVVSISTAAVELNLTSYSESRLHPCS